MSTFCPNCGAPTTSGERFCGSCGQVLESAQAAAPAPESPLEQTRIAGSRTFDDPATPEAAPAAEASQPAAPAQESPEAPWAPPAAQQPAQPASGSHAGYQPPAAPPAPQAQQQWGAPQQQAQQQAQQQWGAPQQQAPQQAQQQWGAPQQQAPQQPQQQWGAPAPQQWGAPGQPQWGQPQQQVAMSNPFAGTTYGDWIRDIGAVVLSFMTFGFLWDLNDDSLPWWVIISLILTALSVIPAYLPRLGSLPISPQVAGYAKLGLNIPSILSIVMALVMSLISITEIKGGEHNGIGLAVAVLAAAVGLALAPRSFEPAGGLWRTLSASLALAGGVLPLLCAIGWIIKEKAFSSENSPLNQFGAEGGKGVLALMVISLVVLSAVLTLALVVVPALRVLKGQPGAGAVLGTVGLGLVGSYVLLSMPDSVEYLHGHLILGVSQESFGGVATMFPGAALVFFTALGGALALGASVLGSNLGSAGWLGTARLALLTAAIGAGIGVVGVLLGSIGSSFGGWSITTLIMLALATGLLVTALMTLPRHSGGSLLLPVASAAIASVLGIVILIMLLNGVGSNPNEAEEIGEAYASAGAVLMSLTGVTVLTAVLFLPLLVVGALTVPKAMRSDFAPLFAARPQAAPQWGAPQMPQAPGGQQAWGAPQSPQAPQQQWGAPQPPQAPQQQWGAPQPPQQWGPPQGGPQA